MSVSRRTKNPAAVDHHNMPETLFYIIYYAIVSFYFILSSLFFQQRQSYWTDGREECVDPKPGSNSISQNHVARDEASTYDDSSPEFCFDACPRSEWCSWPIWRQIRGARVKFEVAAYQCCGTGQAIYRDGLEYPPKCRAEGYWYHATDRDSAEDIIKHGIEVDFGRGMQDFSHKDGFYISPLFANAVNWACNQKREHPAIIIYKLKFNITIFRELELSSNQAEWEMIIKYNRSGRKTTTVSTPMIPDQNLLRRFNESEYVVGPVNGGKAGVRCSDRNWNTWKPSGFQRPHQQLCIKSKRLAEVISDIRNIDAVIFYSSNTKKSTHFVVEK